MEVSQKPFARKTPDQLVYLELGSGNGGMLLSISEEGLRFRAVSPLRASGLVPFAFSFDGANRLEGLGEIEWLEDDGRSGGMRFADVSNDFRAALERWLVAPSRNARSGREATPATSIPLDSMEKIREELRRGYPPHAGPAPSQGLAAQQETVGFPVEPYEELPGETEPTAASHAESVQEGAPIVDTPAPAPKRSPARSAIPATPAPLQPRFSEPEDPSPAPVQAKSGAPKAKREAPTPPARQPVNPVPPAPDLPLPNPLGSPVTSAAPSVPQFSAGGTLFPAPVRPHIPAIDESFDAAWESARLTAPAERPHAKRAASGSIVFLALALISGALAYNFHQEIGLAVIELGRKISGQEAVDPRGPEVRSEAQPARDSGNAEANKAPNDNSGPPAQSAPAGAEATSSSASQPDSEPADGSKHDADVVAGPSAARDAGTTEAAPSTKSRAHPPEPAHTPEPGKPRHEAQPQLQESGNGQEEFAEARELLRGVHRRQDLSRAVDLLWSGVRKGYVPAEVTLADLYRRGDGVERNCDQAQVLLVAASRKGSPDARRMLELMAEEGCE